MDYDFTDSFYAKALAGTSRSTANIPQETTLMYDIRDYDGYSYDFSNDERPILAFNGVDVADGTNFTLTEARDRLTTTKNAFDNVELNLH
jgi:hypothetical protein